MSERSEADDAGMRAPGEEREPISKSVVNYLLGLLIASALTGVSFWVALDTQVFWQPGVALGLGVLAIAQMGIHLVFFLHLTTGVDNLNNSLAVAFGVLIIVLLGAGSLWIMSNLDRRMMPDPALMDLHRQH